MATLAEFRLVNDRIRARVAEAAYSHPEGTVVKFAEPKRSDDQNRKMWAMLEDVRKHQPEGRDYDRETWKAAFMSMYGHEMRVLPGLENGPPFAPGYRTTKLTVGQMAELITLIYAYGDRHGVKWKEDYGLDAPQAG